eukprot:8881766-Ditylum_brightwellii.AAC.1
MDVMHPTEGTLSPEEHDSMVIKKSEYLSHFVLIDPEDDKAGFHVRVCSPDMMKFLDENVDVTNLDESRSVKQSMESPGSTCIPKWDNVPHFSSLCKMCAQHADQMPHDVEHIVVSFLISDNSDDPKR